MNEISSNICQTCLSCDRLLFPMAKFEALLNNLNLQIYNDYEKSKICWECKAIIMKLTKFRNQVLKAQNILTACNLENIPPLSCLKQTEIINTNLIHEEIKTDLETIKKELIDNKESINEILKGNDNINNAEVNNKSTEIKEKNELINDKIKTIILTEDEMIKNRELKGKQPNFKKIPFKCDSCVLGFTCKGNLDLHNEKKHHESLGRHKCPVCLTRFQTLKAMSRHKLRHYTLHKCNLCKYESISLMAASKHCFNKHKNDNNGVIHCGQCEDVYSTPEELKEHMKVKHVLHCEECGEKFKGKKTLRTHITRIHSSQRNFSCDICFKTFNTQSRFESHITSHNPGIAKNLSYCTVCKVQYKNLYIYRNHLRNSKNHSERLYHCKECNKKFASKVYWKKHYDFYHLKKSPFKCDICNKLFMSDWRLKNHKQKHHGLKRTRDHFCNVCGKGFFSLATLRGHKLTHSDERTYMCSDCGDTFKQRPALYTHCKLVHRNEKNK